MVNINKKNMELNADKDKDKSITKDGNTKKEENKIEKNNK